MSIALSVPPVWRTPCAFMHYGLPGYVEKMYSLTPLYVDSMFRGYVALYPTLLRRSYAVADWDFAGA